MPTVYEFVRDGQVLERFQPHGGHDDYEGTRVGVEAIEAQEAAERGELGREYWRIAGEELVNAEPAAEDPVEPTDASPDTAVTPARSAKSARSKEK